MRTLVLRYAVVTMMLCALAAGAFGEVPRVLTLQGKLTDSLGQPVSDGVQSVTFRLYDVETCGQGTALWQEVQNVQTNGGVFNVNLGAVTAIGLPFDKQYWLGMQPATGSELCPRTRLTTAPYAVRAEIADTVKDGAITPEKLAAGVGVVPSGVILMWSGSIATIPQGWVICDGTNGTPNLRDRFLVGASQDVGGVAYTTVKGSPMLTGGEHQHTLTVAEMPSHTHTESGHAWAGCNGGQDGVQRPESVQTGATGGNQPHENCPPFYALAFIMKL